MENSKEFTHTYVHTRAYTYIHKNTLEVLNKFSKFARYNMNMPKQIVFLYTNDEQSIFLTINR